MKKRFKRRETLSERTNEEFGNAESLLALPNCSLGEVKTAPPISAPSGTLNTTRNESYAWVNQTLMLAICTALSYLYAYLYEAGFCGYFGIPLELIKIDTVHILIVGIALFGILYSLMNVYDSGALVFLSKRHSWKKRVVGAIPIILFACLLGSRSFYWVLAYALVAIVAYSIYRDMFLGLRYPKLKEGELHENLFVVLSSKVGFWTVKVAFYICMIGFALKNAGTASAEAMTTFLVPSSSVDTVVLKMYGDMVICAKADFKKHEIYQAFSFHSITSEYYTSFAPRYFKKIKFVPDGNRQ